MFVLFVWVFCPVFGLLLNIQSFAFSPALQQLEIRIATKKMSFARTLALLTQFAFSVHGLPVASQGGH